MQPSAGAIGRRDAIAQHRDDAIKLFACQIAIRPGSPHEIKQIVFRPLLGGAHRHDLLGQQVERGDRNFNRIQPAGSDGAHQRNAFDQFIARERKQPAFGNQSQRVPRTADAL